MDTVKEVPPMFLSLYAIACGLGAMKAPDGKPEEVQEASSKGDAFFSMFGSSGSLGGHGSVN